MRSTMTRWAVVAAAALGMLAAGRAEAGLIGTTVSSPGITFGTSPTSPFSPASVVISDPAVEFTYQSIANTDTFNFSNTTLEVRDVTMNGLGANTFSSTFTDAAFLGASVSVLPYSNFPGISASISGTMLTITSSQMVNTDQTRDAIFTITTPGAAATPEPATLLPLAAGALATGLLGWRRSRRRAA